MLMIRIKIHDRKESNFANRGLSSLLFQFHETVPSNHQQQLVQNLLQYALQHNSGSSYIHHQVLYFQLGKCVNY